MTSRPVPPPVVCSLSPVAMAEQGLEWADLAGLALTREGIEHGVASTFPLDLADQIEDLAGREMDCCGSWLDISTERRADAISLVVTTSNPEGLPIIRSITGLADASP